MSDTSMIIGASAGVGRALARALAMRGHNLLLIARDRQDLEAIAQDFRIRYGVQIWILPTDIASDDFSASSFGDLVEYTTRSVQHVMVAVGGSSQDDVGVPSEDVRDELMTINFTQVAQILNLACERAETWNLKTLMVCSNIVAHLPHNRQIAYATAKSALETYTLGLRHVMANTRVRVQVYVLGHVESAFSFVRDSFFPKALPIEVAYVMAQNLGKDKGRVFLPRYWRLILFFLRLTPWSIFRRVSFSKI